MISMAEQMDYIVSRSGKLDPREQRRRLLRERKAREDKARKRRRPPKQIQRSR